MPPGGIEPPTHGLGNTVPPQRDLRHRCKSSRRTAKGAPWQRISAFVRRPIDVASVDTGGTESGASVSTPPVQMGEMGRITRRRKCPRATHFAWPRHVDRFSRTRSRLPFRTWISSRSPAQPPTKLCRLERIAVSFRGSEPFRREKWQVPKTFDPKTTSSSNARAASSCILARDRRSDASTSAHWRDRSPTGLHPS